MASPSQPPTAAAEGTITDDEAAVFSATTRDGLPTVAPPDGHASVPATAIQQQKATGQESKDTPRTFAVAEETPDTATDPQSEQSSAPAASTQAPAKATAESRRFPLPAAVRIPRGWTRHVSDLDELFACFPAEYYVFSGAVRFVARQDAGDIHVVECAGRYFLWNRLDDDVYRIDEPADDVAEILRRLGASGDFEWDIELGDVEERPVPPERQYTLAPRADSTDDT